MQHMYNPTRRWLNKRTQFGALAMLCIASALALLGAPEASASVSCLATTRCEIYLQGGSGAATYQAVSGNVNYTCMPAVPDSSWEFTGQTTWISTGGATPYWVETGLTVGYGNPATSTPYYYWARNSSDAGYGEWTASGWGTAPKNTDLNLSIQRNSGGFTWQIFQGSRVLGSANSPADTMYYVRSGGEANAAVVQDAGKWTGIKTKYNNGGWVNTIGPNNGYNIIPSTGYFALNGAPTVTSIAFNAPSFSGAGGC
jgi:hypothetical protein